MSEALRFREVATARIQPAELAQLAVRSLVEEAELTPKPGLVDQRSSGAHHDLTLGLLLASAHALEPWFLSMAESAETLPFGRELRQSLAALGRAAEEEMLAATGGVNTHRGAIWTLGLLVAAARGCGSCDAEEICGAAGRLASLPDRFAPAVVSHGLQAKQKFGATGAREEAAAGFPHVLRFGLPGLHAARLQGASEREAKVQALLSLMAHLSDTCLLHRGGQAALAAAQHGARRCLDAGGCMTAFGCHELERLEACLIEMWASPGGSADLLAATIFLDSLRTERGL